MHPYFGWKILNRDGLGGEGCLQAIVEIGVRLQSILSKGVTGTVFQGKSCRGELERERAKGQGEAGVRSAHESSLDETEK
jgi:hypothetical protein